MFIAYFDPGDSHILKSNMKFFGENTSNLTELSINHVVNKVKHGARQVAKSYQGDETLPVQSLTSVYKN